MKKPEAPFHRAPGNYDVIAACEECCVQDFGPSMTQQSDLEDSDINNIVKRFGLGIQPNINPRTPQYADFSNLLDYRSALHAIQEADHAFMKIPAGIRARFDNDPQKYLEFCEEPANLPELRKLGLAKPEETPERPTGPAGVVPTPDPKPAPG